MKDERVNKKIIWIEEDTKVMLFDLKKRLGLKSIDQVFSLLFEDFD